MRERTIIIDGFSKAYAMTGWRLGYAIMPAAARARRDALQQQHVLVHRQRSCRRAGIAALDRPRRTGDAMVDEFRTRRDALGQGAQRDPGHHVHDARRRVLCLPQRHARSRATTRTLASFILEQAHVGCLGGSCFGAAGRGYVRFSYATSLGHIELALERLAAALPNFKNA